MFWWYVWPHFWGCANWCISKYAGTDGRSPKTNFQRTPVPGIRSALILGNFLLTHSIRRVSWLTFAGRASTFCQRPVTMLDEQIGQAEQV